MITSKFIGILTFVLRLVLGFIFIYASVDKILHPAQFAKVIYHYQVLPMEIINVVAIIIPWLEAILGMTLILGIWLETTALMLSAITFVFIALMGSAMARGLNIECGCFSLDPEAAVIGWHRIFEDGLMLFASLFIFIYASKGSPEKPGTMA